MGLAQGDPIIDSTMDPLRDECRQLDVDQQRETSKVQEPLFIVTTVGVDALSIGQHISSSSAAKVKPPPKLGIL